MDDREAEWIYAEPVTYLGNHDPSDIELKDGRDLRVFYGTVTWQEVQQWKSGQKLNYLSYSAGMGCVLVDSETLAQLPVIRGWNDRHPLDLLLKQDLRLTCSTMDISFGLRRQRAALAGGDRPTIQPVWTRRGSREHQGGFSRRTHGLE